MIRALGWVVLVVGSALLAWFLILVGAVADEARQVWTCPMCGREITVEAVFRVLLAAKVGP